MQRNVSKSVLQVQEVLLFFLVIAKVTKVALMKSNERNICHWDAALKCIFDSTGKISRREETVRGKCSYIYPRCNFTE